MMTSPFAPLATSAAAPVWAHFATLCRIPRPSKQEHALREHLRQWAVARGLRATVDGVGNLIVAKPGSPGREHYPGVILQGHLDMVCQKNSDSAHDFARDPIQPRLRDGWLEAPETTLGADNGIGVALALAVLERDDLVHGPIEVLLTVDEEAGMGGAQGLEPGLLHGRLMLNLDTEEWGEFYLGCAGGLDVNVARPGAADLPPVGWQPWQVALRGLRGGHSGVNIHEERGNAIKLLVRVLRDLETRLPLRLAGLHGGTARNALPREATATVFVPATGVGDLTAALGQWEGLLQDELQGVDTGVELAWSAGRADQVLTVAEQEIWLASLQAAPHGVWRMSRTVPGVVETSNNLGIVAIDAHGGMANFMVRSLRDSGSAALADGIVSLFSLSASRAEKVGAYPGWTPNPDSPLLALCQKVYQEQFGASSRVQVIHAGLECGLIAAKYPGLDIVSFGPTIRGAHAPGEAVEVAAVERTWQLLQAILAAIPASRSDGG